MIKPILGRVSDRKDNFMPSKASRAASRQSKLSRKKRRDKPGPRQMDLGPTRTDPEADTVGTAVADPVVEVESTEPVIAVAEVSSQPRTSHSPVARQQHSRRRPGRRVTEAGEAQVYKHLGGELRQIGIITVIIAAILGGLTFVLG